jgi:hypothetical protein
LKGKSESQTAKDKQPAISKPEGSSAPGTSSVAPSRSFVDSIESATIKSLLSKFPMSEVSARGINATDWTKSVFALKEEGGETRLTFPRNIENFTDSLLIMSLIKLCELNNWIPTLSESDVPKAVLETKEGAFFAGFVTASTRSETGPMNTGTTKFSKGIKSFQCFSVEKSLGKPMHLRTGGMDKLTERLSEMKGFTKEHWGLRASIVSLFKSVKPAKVTELATYFRSKNEIMKNIKTKLQYENGGCFRPEELVYLADRYEAAKAMLTTFLSKLDNPTEDLAKTFNEEYSRVKIRIDAADNDIKANLAARARILFPMDKKKKSVVWAKSSITEKLQSLEEEKLAVFRPESLPGINAKVTNLSFEKDSEAFVLAKFGEDQEDTADEVISSWYNSFEPSSRGN